MNVNEIKMNAIEIKKNISPVLIFFFFNSSF